MTLSPVVTSHWLILERTNPVVNPVVVSQKLKTLEPKATCPKMLVK